MEMRIAKLESRLSEYENRLKRKLVTVLFFSDNLEKLSMVFPLINGSLSLGAEVHVFFASRGVCAFRDFLARVHHKQSRFKKGILKLKRILSLKHCKDKKREELSDMMKDASELGVVFHFCQRSAELFRVIDDFNRYDFYEGVGVTTYLQYALDSDFSVNIF